MSFLDGSAVQNEIRAMTKLYNERNKNIIQVLGHGKFPDSSYAFIDMELCDFSLDEYNKCTWIVAQVEGTRRESHIWNVMMQIASGLSFIHNNKEIHRDLKPSNGTYVHIPHE